MTKAWQLTAQRFAGKPLAQPSYSMKDVPHAKSNLQGSKLLQVTNQRDYFNDSMAEMVLLCNEVMRRKTIQEALREKQQQEMEEQESKQSSRDASLDPVLQENKEQSTSDNNNCVDSNNSSTKSSPNKDNKAKKGGRTPKSTKKEKKQRKKPSKPLSLEYMADRLDVDDPMYGFVVRTDIHPSMNTNHASDPSTASQSSSSHLPTATNISSPLPTSNPMPLPQSIRFKKGMLQGFITVTTFTNWQKTFRWDSLHEEAYSYDDDELATQMANGERKYDIDGSLAAEMQNTVRCGDPWNEGIVWPRIAELSLLGALGCGRPLLSMAIESLESKPPSSKHNYDYVALQATSNSKAFYESMGFIRVGAITSVMAGQQNEQNNDSKTNNDANSAKKNGKKTSKKNGAATYEKRSEVSAKKDATNKSNQDETGKVPLSSSTSKQQESQIVSSPVFTVEIAKHGETPNEYAKKYNVNVWDIIFLNHYIYPDIAPNSKLMKGTILHIPDIAKYDGGGIANKNIGSCMKSEGTEWYFSLDDETPMAIAKKFGVDCKDLVQANKGRIESLYAQSRLMEGTRIQVSNLSEPTKQYYPYCHWTFPDDKFENSEPSYMMARKLNRKSGAAAKIKPFEASLATPLIQYDPQDASMKPPVISVEPPIKTPTKKSSAIKTPKKSSSKKRKLHPEEPIPPKRPQPSYFFFLKDIKAKLREDNPTWSMVQVTKESSLRWKEVSPEGKIKYDEMSKKEREEYHLAKAQYNQDLEKFRLKYPDWQSQIEAKEEELSTISPANLMPKTLKGSKNLFNKVVKLNSDGQQEAGNEYQYYYVLTYLPDLFWCHLVPMVKVGTFGPNKNKRKADSEGRPIWMLVDEEQGKELDITAKVCQVVKARTMRGCKNADDEEWDIHDDPSSNGRTLVKDKKMLENSPFSPQPNDATKQYASSVALSIDSELNAITISDFPTDPLLHANALPITDWDEKDLLDNSPILKQLADNTNNVNREESLLNGKGNLEVEKQSLTVTTPSSTNNKVRKKSQTRLDAFLIGTNKQKEGTNKATSPSEKTRKRGRPPKVKQSTIESPSERMEDDGMNGNRRVSKRILQSPSRTKDSTSEAKATNTTSPKRERRSPTNNPESSDMSCQKKNDTMDTPPKRKRGRPPKIKKQPSHNSNQTIKTSSVPEQHKSDATDLSPKRKRGRPPKVKKQDSDDSPETTNTSNVPEEDNKERTDLPPTPKRKRGRPPKVKKQENHDTPEMMKTSSVPEQDNKDTMETPPKRKRGRPPKVKKEERNDSPEMTNTSDVSEQDNEDTTDLPPKRKRGRPRKSENLSDQTEATESVNTCREEKDDTKDLSPYRNRGRSANAQELANHEPEKTTKRGRIVRIRSAMQVDEESEQVITKCKEQANSPQDDQTAQLKRKRISSPSPKTKKVVEDNKDEEEINDKQVDTPLRLTRSRAANKGSGKQEEQEDAILKTTRRTKESRSTKRGKQGVRARRKRLRRTKRLNYAEESDISEEISEPESESEDSDQQSGNVVEDDSQSEDNPDAGDTSDDATPLQQFVRKRINRLRNRRSQEEESTSSNRTDVIRSLRSSFPGKPRNNGGTEEDDASTVSKSSSDSESAVVTADSGPEKENDNLAVDKPSGLKTDSIVRRSHRKRVLRALVTT